MSNFKEKVHKFLVWDTSDIDKDIFYKNEVLANRSAAITNFNIALADILIIVLSLCGLIAMNEKTRLYMAITTLEFLIPAILCFIFKGRKKWIKYVEIIGCLLGIVFIYIMQSTFALIFLIIPLILSCRYYSSKFISLIGALTFALFALAMVCGPLYGSFDLKIVDFSEPVTITVDRFLTDEILQLYPLSKIFKGNFIMVFLPTGLGLAIISYIVWASASKGKKMAEQETQMLKDSTRIEAELNLATQIQSHMLPTIFPAFPNYKEFDIYATMSPAKEVGGDLYDLFMTDENHIAIVIGDVSGKGVPAALFMVTAKTLIKDQCLLGLSPQDVFNKVNERLCEGNDAGLFVTGWLGILDIKTGVLTYCNAGHNSPLIYHKETGYTYLKGKHGFVLAGLDSMRYQQESLTMQPGDKVFLYTDGITEATSAASELYGEARLKDFLNQHANDDIHDLLPEVSKELDDFAGTENQFDDETMLILDFKSYKK